MDYPSLSCIRYSNELFWKVSLILHHLCIFSRLSLSVSNFVIIVNFSTISLNCHVFLKKQITLMSRFASSLNIRHDILKLERISLYEFHQIWSIIHKESGACPS